MVLHRLLQDIERAQRAGDYRGALAIAERATGSRPDTPSEWIALAKWLAYFNESGALVELGRQALRKPSWSAAAEAALAALISMSGEQEIALDLLQRSIRLAGNQPDWIYNRSQIHQYRGELALAEKDLRACLAQDPRRAKLHWALSKLGVPIEDEELATLQQLASQAPEDGPDAAFLGFALFSHLDRRGEMDAAWTALARGCRAKRHQVRYDSAATLGYLRALSRWTPAGRPAPVEHAPTPIFVVGMHRTGTSLLERILGGHSEVIQGGELYDLPAQLRWAIGRHFPGASDPGVLAAAERIDFPQLGRRYLERISWRAHGKRAIVDKLPSNFLNVGYIGQALPGAKVLHIHRAPMDTCFSNLKELFANACAYSYDQVELADYFLAYRTLMRHWQTSLPDFVLDVSYEALIADPEREARRILAFCGLDWQPGCLDTQSSTRATNTASSAQVREPIHRRNVEAWRRYAGHLAPMKARLQAGGEPVAN